MQSDELCCSGWVWLSRQGTCQLSMLVRFGQHAVGCQGSRKLPERMVSGCEGLTPARDVLSVQNWSADDGIHGCVFHKP